MPKGKLLEALQLAGDNKMYQKSLIVLISILWLSINCIMLGQSYIYIDPVFTCQSTGEKQITQEEACKIIKQCTIIYPGTLTAHLNLYCDRENDRVAIQSVYAIGSFVGLILMNFLSDVKGRKFSIVISTGFMIIGTAMQILGGIYDQTFLLIIAQMVNGFGSYSLITLSYILLSDFCSSKYRQVGTILINSAWGFSTILLGYLYVIDINWLTFLIWVLQVPLVLTAVFIVFMLIESPYILIRQNKHKECIESFARICYFNKTQQNMKQIQQIVMQQKQKTLTSQNFSNQTSFKHVFNIIKRKSNLKLIIFLTTIHLCAVIYYYGVAYAMSEQGNGFGVNMIIAGGVQTVSYALLTLFVTKMKRVKGLLAYYGLTSIIGLLFLIPVIHQNFILTSSLLGLSRFFSTIAYTLLACIQVQSFNVQIQSTAVGLIQASCMFGVLISPVIVDIANHFLLDPVALISIIFLIFGLWPNFFLKQTLPGLHIKDEQNISILKQQYQDFIDPLINPQDKSVIYSITNGSSVQSQHGIN